MLYEFLAGKAPANGFTVYDCIDADDTWIETTHDFIQVCFPTYEPSAVLPDAEVLTDETIQLIQSDKICMRNLYRMASRMLSFYTVHPVLLAWDHNCKRLTRIMKCLNIFGITDLYKEYKTMTQRFAECSPKIIGISKETKKYWQEA